MQDDDTSFAKIYFYDVNKKKVIDLFNWNKKLINYKISSAYFANNCVYLLATNVYYVLICLNLNNGTWQECDVFEEFIESTEEYQNPSIQYDGHNMYLGFYHSDEESWIYYTIIHNQSELFIKPISFIKGKINSFQPCCSYNDKTIFLVSGSNIQVYNEEEKLQKRFHESQLLLCYDGNSFELIDSNKENGMITYDTRIRSTIYYEKENQPKLLYEYHLQNGKCKVKQLQHDEEFTIAYNEIYLHTQATIQRISDQKIIFVADIIDKFEKINAEKVKDIELFPSLWWFHDHWIEADTDDCACFLLEIDTMKAFYFDKPIDIEEKQIYLYEKPFFYMN